MRRSGSRLIEINIIPSQQYTDGAVWNLPNG